MTSIASLNPAVRTDRWAWPQGLSRRLQALALASLGLLVPLLLLAFWQYAVNRGWLAEQILPAPALVWQSLTELLASGELLEHLSISLSRIGWSLVWGGLSGVILGFALGLSRSARQYLYPSFELLSQFPLIGWVPLLMVFLGIDEGLKIATISLAVVVPVTLNLYQGIANLPRALLEVSQVYRFGLWQRLTQVVLPGISPSLFNGFRQGVMQAWLALVFVELLASSEGIGYLMVWGRQLLQLDLVFVSMLVIALIGGLFELVLRTLERRLRPVARSAF